MNNISRSLAESITRKLLAKKTETVEALEESFNNRVRELFMNSLPTYIQDMPNNLTGYLNTTTNVKIFGEGFSHDIVYVNPPVPHDGEGWHVILKVVGRVASTLSSQHVKATVARKSLKEASEKVLATIMSLKTKAKIVAAFPETETFFPEQQKTEMINIENVRKLLK